jgi:hypothetical protein
MTLYEFNAMNELQQLSATLDGLFITSRRVRGNNVLLYQLEKFYVELYHHNKNNFISKIRSFSSTSQLDPYLENIDIEELFES